MGLFRNLRRSKLKKQLLKEAELNQYLQSFDVSLEKLQKMKQKYLEMVKEAKSQNNQETLELGMNQTMLVQENIKKIMHLKQTLEAAKMSLDNQEIYNNFVDAVSKYTGAMKEQKMRRGKMRAVMNQHVREQKYLKSQMELVDDKIKRIEKNVKQSLDIEVPRKEKPIDKEAFFKEFNIE